MSIPITSETVVQDQRVVQYVRVVVHTLGPAGPSISDNHWSIYLLLANNNSVRINMTAEPGFIDGTLKWTQQSYLLTTSAIRYWEFPVSQGVQFRHIANLIHQLGRQRYDMSGGGSGCRYWVYTIIYDIANKNWINSNAAIPLWPDLLYRYHTINERKALPMVQGTFY